MSQRRKGTLLTNLELEVMRIVWEATRPPLTVREVTEELNRGRRKPLAYNTVQTMLTILRDKGVVRVTPGPGRAFRYEPRLSREEVNTSMVGDLIERLFDGRAEPLLLHLVEHEALGREDLEALRRVIDTHLDDRDAEDPHEVDR